MKKKILISMFLIFFGFNLNSQTPDLNTNLYYTCKVWGYAKYFHSEVSNCKANWDSVLIVTLPLIKSTGTEEEFNSALLNMLNAAGAMEDATTPPPDEIPEELRYNLNFNWFEDAILSSDVKEVLYNVKENYRTHENCMVEVEADMNWLHFPQENPIINRDFFADFPDENERLFVLFKFWNIINYFSPNNDILDTPWDSTLYKFIDDFISATDYETFVKTFQRITSKLDDAHAEGFSSSYFNMFGKFRPRIILRYASGNYVVVKSDYSEIKIGDIINSIDDLITSEWEDSLRSYISVSNTNTFRHLMCYKLLSGDSSSTIEIKYTDSTGILKNLSLERNYSSYNDSWFYIYHPCDSLYKVIYKKYEGNIGYVNMAILYTYSVIDMYNSLYNTKAIIFDVRNYPNGTTYEIAKYLFPQKKCFVKFKVPDVNYPGTFSWVNSYLGTDNNPVAYKGKVIILCDERSISHAEFTCMGLRAFPGAIVVGNQTAGADGNITRIYISQDIRATFTNLGVFYPDGTPTQRIGIIPDSIVYPTAEGIRQGRDEVLEKALEIAGCDPTPVIDDLNIVKSEITVYPNPSGDYITISGVAGEAKIYNIMGREVWKSFIKNETQISLSKFSPGLYYLKTDKEMQTKQFVVIK